MILEGFSLLGFFSANPVIAWAVFGLAAAGFGVVSWVLHFHWREYGMGKRAVGAAETAYFVGGMGILASAFAALLAI